MLSTVHKEVGSHYQRKDKEQNTKRIIIVVIYCEMGGGGVIKNKGKTKSLNYKMNVGIKRGQAYKMGVDLTYKVTNKNILHYYFGLA